MVEEISYGPGSMGLCIVEDRRKEVLTPDFLRAAILAIQDRVSALPGAVLGDSDLCPLKHSFAPGVYVREIFIPAGVIIVGKIHKHEHPNFLMKGRVSVITEQGGVEELAAPLSMISPAGTKRVVVAHEDTVWITIHQTTETDLEKIEEEIIAKSFEDYERFKGLTVETREELPCHGE